MVGLGALFTLCPMRDSISRSIKRNLRTGACQVQVKLEDVGGVGEGGERSDAIAQDRRERLWNLPRPRCSKRLTGIL